ncbi:MAG: VWA domain-containing protein [Armatimonadota bacterium]|nr:VWA domain-containing protein [Armatimonadota bacterium]
MTRRIMGMVLLTVMLYGGARADGIAYGGARADGIPATSLTNPAAPALEVVFCLDISGSMGSYLNEAKRMIKTVVSMADSIQPRATLRVGVIRYGSGDARFGVLPLTPNIAAVYAYVDETGIAGAYEPVGRFVQIAAQQMNWSSDPATAKAIYMVGNETAAQGAPHYSQTIPDAVARGIMVNAVLCEMISSRQLASSAPSQEDERTWQEVAQLGRGYYFRLGTDWRGNVINRTPRGEQVRQAWQKDQQWDQWFTAQAGPLLAQMKLTAVLYNLNLAEPAQSKRAQAYQLLKSINNQLGGLSLTDLAASAAVRQNVIDLVDAVNDPSFDFSQLDPRGLPREMQGMTLPQVYAYVRQKAGERAALRQQLNELHMMRLMNKRPQ